MARVGVAIPWIVFAIVIVALGGIPFAIALIGISIVGMAELFRMTRRFHPLAPVAFAAAAALVIAAHYGGQFQMMIVLVASFPVMFRSSAVVVRQPSLPWPLVPAAAHLPLAHRLPRTRRHRSMCTHRSAIVRAQPAI